MNAPTLTCVSHLGGLILIVKLSVACAPWLSVTRTDTFHSFLGAAIRRLDCGAKSCVTVGIEPVLCSNVPSPSRSHS